MSANLFSAMFLAQTSGIDPNNFNNYLMLGYGVMGLIALGYIVTLYLRQRNLHKDLQLMDQLLQEDEEA